MAKKMSRGLLKAREESRQRIAAGRADQEAASRYRDLAERWPTMAEDFLERAVECDRLASIKLKSFKRS